MRKKEKEGPLSVHAIAGSYVVLFGIDMEEDASAGVLGFAIERTDHSMDDKRDWLAGFRIFKDSVPPPSGKFVTTEQHPLQTFMWCDFTIRKNHEYTYRIVAMRGEPGNLEEGESVSVRIQMENEDEGTHAVYFNRGVAGSQAYLRKFGNKRPEEVPDREAWRWLSRGLFRALLNFIKQANGSEYGLRAAVYEFNQGAVVKAFGDAAGTGADVKVVFDARQVINEAKPENSKLDPAKTNREAIDKAGIEGICTERTANPQAISHNKFIILLKDGKPEQVWTGSTNMTDGGIFGHSNVGHIVRDPEVAVQYLKYWEKLSTDPIMDRKPENDEIRPWNEENFPVPDDLPEPNSTIAIFSPRPTLQALEWYAQRMDAAQTAVFLTAAFGVSDKFEQILSKPKDYLRYLLLESKDKNMESLLASKYNCIAVGSILEQNKFDQWMKERLSDLNDHVKFIHTKYMLINPLSDDPIVITGSANFSDASTRRNDENMLVIRGDTRVADIYLGEFMRLYNHFKFRELANLKKALPNPDDVFLAPDDSWRLPYYEKDSVKAKEREYFAGN
ncbi:MAG TPA: phospholipase D-like domain-containing protein [Pyrinomonadaceae bacterium]|jgi:phosphatidylserine/phosphatidylglycerophosphate/cardiolipin synthase-like enzyme|nr:phospholipase D-like domain-containing protein [Pyrinomonadaceae bacterium]